MRLKRLEISGFKSFPEKTQVRLVEGVTAIVGPNGCGKTNILDALRWVMGEQRPTLLRGGKMEDVIFNGSQNLKPYGMAEVSLTIQNTRGILPTEYNELQLTRRLFRSGESEYMLNRRVCRLRDITDLFADTGMGANAYSVIQQHMIDSLISDKAEDRRLLFEEAAGITKYKQRKRAALRKLEATEHDLQRLQDIVSEVKTQVNSLNRQMKKAERYQQTHTALKNLELTLGKVTVQALEAERKEKNLALAELNDIVRKCETDLTALNASLETDRNQLDQFDSRLAEVSRERQDRTEAAHRLDKEISSLKERIQSLKDLRTRNDAEIVNCDRRLQQLSTDEIQLRDQLTDREAALQIQLANVDRANRESKEADAASLDARAERQTDTDKLVALEGRISSGKSDSENLSQREKEITDRIKRANQELQTLSERLTTENRKREELQNNVTSAGAKVDQIASRIAEINALIESLNTKLEERSERITELSSALESAQTRKRLLEETIKRHEGLRAGASFALDNRNRWDDLLGSLSELITPHQGYARAIEAALEDVAGHLVARDRKTARRIIKALAAEKKGKASVYSLADISEQSHTGDRAPINEPGFVAWAGKLISPNSDVKALSHALLANTAVFDDTLDQLDDTTLNALLSRLPAGCQIVTTAGTLYRAKGLSAGGVEEGLPLFGRKERLDALTDEATRLEKELADERSARGNESAEVARLRAELTTCDSQIEDAREERGDAEKLLSEAGAQLKALENDRQRLDREKADANKQLELLKHRQYTLSLDVDQLADEKQRLMESTTARAERLKDLESKAQKAAEALNRLQVQLVEEKSHISQLTDRIGHLQDLKNEVTQTRNQKQTEIEIAERETSEARVKIENLEVQLKSVFEERDAISARETDIRREREGAVTALREVEEKLKAARSKKDQATSEAHKLDLRISQIESENNSTLERLREEYSIDPLTYTPAPAVEGEPTYQFETTEQRAEVRKVIHEMRERLKGFGAVNLLALEEYDSATERYDQLSVQLEDLLNAKNTLQSTITKINNTAREMFSDTFERARKNFQSIFTELFTGGECDISLRDESDPLESDIEIIARPKGKKLVTITQMSGGERALTAISLLFSLYLVKPSPFCILDEIDAPLDDANCHRFLRMIRRFSEQTQFIVITHNKITMEAADTMYGVTMEQPGVSKLVAVHFAEDTEGGTRIVPVAEEPAADESIQREPVSSEGDVPPAVVERMTTKLNLVRAGENMESSTPGDDDDLDLDEK